MTTGSSIEPLNLNGEGGNAPASGIQLRQFESTWNGADSPNWGRDKARLGDSSQSRSFTKTSYRLKAPVSKNFSWRVERNCYGTGWSYWNQYNYTGLGVSVLTPFGSPNPKPYSSAMDDLVRGRFYASARSKLTKLNSVAMLGESVETGKYVADKLSRLLGTSGSYVAQAKNALRRIKRNPLRVASELWLEYNYAARPLAADIESVCDAFGKKDFSEKIFVSGAIPIVSSSHGDKSSQNIGGAGSVNFWTIYSGKGERSFRCGGLLKRPSFPYNLRRFGISADEVVLGLYELIPYSFLVDYFTNVGQMLGAVMFRQSLLVYAWETGVDTINHVLRGYTDTLSSSGPCVFRTVDTNFPLGSSFEGAHATTVRIVRSTGVSLPAFTVRLPGWRQASLVAALGVSKFSKR